MTWFEDKEKNGEIFCNSDDLVFCLKVFRGNKRVELWDAVHHCGYVKTFDSFAEALFTYRIIKGLAYRKIIPYVSKEFKTAH